jgi:hypothetical protein
MNDLPMAMSPELEDLTIRDYIAIQVLPVFLANPETNYKEDVEDAYRVADAMLKARARQ